MIQQAGRKVLEGIREWPSAAGGLSRRLRKEQPAVARRSGWMDDLGAPGFRPGKAAWVLAGAALAAAFILLLYLRKRRQVTAHYRMGEAAPEGSDSFALREMETARS